MVTTLQVKYPNEIQLLEFYDERNKIEVKNNVQLLLYFLFYFLSLRMPINRLIIDKSKLK